MPATTSHGAWKVRPHQGVALNDAAAERFEETLRFRMTVIPYDASDDWVEDHIKAAKKCLLRGNPPPASDECPYCDFAAHRA